MKAKDLCQAVEKMVGKTMYTPRDFEWLSEQIFKQTHEMLSATTLQRLWGYIEDHVQPRRITLDILAHFVGMRSYDAFCHNLASEEAQSYFTLSHCLSTKDLCKGQRIRITWQSSRGCIMEHCGDGQFIIVECENTKLSVGDIVTCHTLIEGEPLFLDTVVHDGRKPTAFIAGRQDGIHFTLL
ncbi:MAG: hypothetical protein J1F25_01135 [Prevotellaceae bacterium]|nr:hypothetical protein [Prevotellaceae bacterium]